MPKVRKSRAAKGRKTKAAPRRFLGLIERYGLASLAGASLIAAALLLILWAGGYFGVLAEKAHRLAGDAAITAGFDVRRVTLRGAHELSHEEILGAIGPVIGRSMLHVSPEKMRRAVENLGWVEAASVTRLFPGAIHISIRERAPAAVWQVNGELHLIDDGGARIREVGAYEYSNLPLIVGAGAPEAAAPILRALASRADLKYMTYALVRVGERRWNLRLRNGLDIKLPEIGFERAIDDVALLHAAHGTLDHDIEYIDLRDPERLTIRKRDATGSNSENE